jgi:hypothetical protein
MLVARRRRVLTSVLTPDTVEEAHSTGGQSLTDAE